MEGVLRKLRKAKDHGARTVLWVFFFICYMLPNIMCENHIQYLLHYLNEVLWNYSHFFVDSR
jgi:hypothetical protein